MHGENEAWFRSYTIPRTFWTDTYHISVPHSPQPHHTTIQHNTNLQTILINNNHQTSWQTPGTVLFDTDDYIDLCLQQLARIGPYQQGRILHRHIVQVLHVLLRSVGQLGVSSFPNSCWVGCIIASYEVNVRIQKISNHWICIVTSHSPNEDIRRLLINFVHYKISTMNI